MKIHLNAVEEHATQSPKEKFGLLRRHISDAILAGNDQNLNPPFDLEHAILAPGKRNYPCHTHAAMWEMYYALSGSAQMRVGDEIHEFSEGESFLCPPGQPHQLINESDSDFEFLVIADNPVFDTCYYPDSDKLNLNPKWGATPKGMKRAWTLVNEGIASSYWDGEE